VREKRNPPIRQSTTASQFRKMMCTNPNANALAMTIPHPPPKSGR
jgi:hypothetical protein